jgi:3'-phosphoadenosine 5'-phosphosulfate sulfotransferase (PAPS reductase)/FAD synthetase
MIAMSGVPNVTTRLCTQELKIRVMKKFMRRLDYSEWTNVVGIRADEPNRVAKLRVKPRERWENAVPLADAGVTVEDVLEFWSKQRFDLALRNDPVLGTYEGNCDLCMLKSEPKKLRLVQDRPESLAWWESMEGAAKSPFRPKAPYAMFRLPVLCDSVESRSGGTEDLGDCICHE